MLRNQVSQSTRVCRSKPMILFSSWQPSNHEHIIRGITYGSLRVIVVNDNFLVAEVPSSKASGQNTMLQNFDLKLHALLVSSSSGFRVWIVGLCRHGNSLYLHDSFRVTGMSLIQRGQVIEDPQRPQCRPTSKYDSRAFGLIPFSYCDRLKQG